HPLPAKGVVALQSLTIPASFPERTRPAPDAPFAPPETPTDTRNPARARHAQKDPEAEPLFAPSLSGARSQAHTQAVDRASAASIFGASLAKEARGEDKRLKAPSPSDRNESQVASAPAGEGHALASSRAPSLQRTGGVPPSARLVPAQAVQAIAEAVVEGRAHQLVIELDPPHLGKLRAQLRLRGHEVHLHLRVDAPEAQQALIAQLPALRATLAEGGFSLAHFACDCGSQGSHTGRSHEEVSPDERAPGSPRSSSQRAAPQPAGGISIRI
ncbi:MAG: flagellar hook-length control protein FliK, partial [Zetaproteobacteria bacterium]